ncbi:MAG TPA: N-acetylmuramoyl-L-alanine amidase-like domain-containing protein [Balneolales bacterium]|nr:N-acetylmuramoyl-L-alanine amidase-like domain-containing protein [Balneolales bacterium]
MLKKIIFSAFVFCITFLSVLPVKAQNKRFIISNWLKDGIEHYKHDSTLSDLISFYAEKQFGIPYKAGLLDKPKKEKLVITLKGSDCVIYVETSMALALTTLERDTSYNTFANNLKLLRYRNGHIHGYFSRLNYFSDWLLTNQKKGLVSIVSQHWPDSVPMDSVYYMSHHRYQYPGLAHNDSLLDLIKHKERQLSQDSLKYLPKNKIPLYIRKINTGDILAFVTTVKGLDVSHTAIAYRKGDFLTFFHANPKHGITTEPLGLLPYIYSRKTVKGIIVARLKDLSPS